MPDFEFIRPESTQRVEVVLHGIDASKVRCVTIEFNDGQASTTQYTYNEDGTVRESRTSFARREDDQIPGQMSLSDFIDMGNN